MRHVHWRLRLTLRLTRMEAYLRQWREHALSKHQYDAAIYVGDKLLALTSVYFLYLVSSQP